jgi:hypothetical protein
VCVCVSLQDIVLEAGEKRNLVFSLTAVTNGPLKPEIWHFVLKQIINIHTSFIQSTVNKTHVRHETGTALQGYTCI